ncbi:MAG: hypothetical protein AB1714_04865 [Acidobacteriota bacterium]
MKATWQGYEAEHVFFGDVLFLDHQFHSDPAFPLSFRLTTEKCDYDECSKA